MADADEGFSAAQRPAGEGAAGATAAFPYDRMTVERFRTAFPRARWRDDLGAWFVPGTTAERRLTGWMAREWSGVLRHADARGQDSYAFDPFESPYLSVEDGFVVRTPFSRAVVELLRAVPWARWDPAIKAWRVPFRSVDELRRCWSVIEEAAQRAEPAERRKRRDERRGSAEAAEAAALAAERRRHRYPVPHDALPPLDRVVMTHAGPAVFEAVTGELAEPEVTGRFYPGVKAGPDGTLVWATWRRPSHDELVHAWPARADSTAAELARGWWQPTLDTLRTERRRAASLDRARLTRAGKDATLPET